MAGIVANSYADALFALAQEEQKLDVFKEQLCFVSELVKENKEFNQILTHPKIHKDEKKQTMEEVFGKVVDHTVLNFMKLLIDKGRFLNLTDITKEFVKRYNEENHIVVANVKSAKALSQEEIKRLQVMLERKLDKKIEMRLYTDPSLLAGLRIKVNDVVLDNTALSRMENLKQLAASTNSIEKES